MNGLTLLSLGCMLQKLSQAADEKESSITVNMPYIINI